MINNEAQYDPHRPIKMKVEQIIKNQVMPYAENLSSLF